MLKVENLSYRKNNTYILNNITLSLSRGEIVGIIGPNGAGKSTLFKIISGLLKPTEGMVTIDNKDIKQSNDFENNFSILGSFIEKPSIYKYLTGREQLRLILDYHDIESDENINKTVRQLGMQEYIDRKIKGYSLGMKQKIGIASTIIHDPYYVILDEPTNSLDITTIIELKELIFQLKRENKGILISSHIISEIQEICDRVIILDNGEIKGNSNCVMNNAEIERTYGIVLNKTGLSEYYEEFSELYSFRQNKRGEVEIVVRNSEINIALQTILEKEVLIEKINTYDKGLTEVYFERIKPHV